MDKSESSKPIQTIFDGTNYMLWADDMCSFLKGRRLWRYVSGDLIKPVKNDNESDDDFCKRFEEWDCTNHQIISWFRNTIHPQIKSQFGREATPKQIWDFLDRRYARKGRALGYKLFCDLANLKQKHGQSVQDFLFQIQSIWDQMSLSEPSWKCTEDAENYAKLKEEMRVYQFCMALTSNFESVRSSLLHREPPPTLETVISEVLAEETRLATLKSQHTDSSDHLVATISPCSTVDTSCSTAGAVTSALNASRKIFCYYCKKPGHIISECRKLKAKQAAGSSQPTSRSSIHGSQSVAAAATEGSTASPSISISDLETLLKQLAHKSGSPLALSNVPGSPTSWYFDSGCCNHMTFNDNAFVTKSNTCHVPIVRTANNSVMSVSHIGNVCDSNLDLPDVFCVPTLTLNLISVGQLTELDLDVTFSKSCCRVQDPQTGEILGTGRKVGRLFELVSLKIPQKKLYNFVASTSFGLWHSRLGHTCSSRVKLLASSGKLGTVKEENVDCTSCKLAKHHALPFVLSDTTSLAPFDLVHTDVWGPSPCETMGGAKYFVIFVDDYSRFTWIYLMKNRSQIPEIVSNFVAMVKTQFSCPIKVLRMDNAMEYRETDLIQCLSQ